MHFYTLQFFYDVKLNTKLDHLDPNISFSSASGLAKGTAC